jgi:hypothetical protein
MTRCIFRQANRYQGLKLVPLIIIFASAVITLEQKPQTQPQWSTNSNQKADTMLTRKN